MNFEVYDRNAPWPKPEDGFQICIKHQKSKVMVTHHDDECPLCKAEARVEELEAENRRITLHLENLSYQDDGIHIAQHGNTRAFNQ